MADVRTRIGRGRSGGGRRSDSSSGGDDRDRGQLILVTGLAVAVTLVALVLLLNTVIYTQNLATRGPQVEDGEAVAFRNEVVEGVGATVDAQNRDEYESQQYATRNVTEAIERYDELGSRYRVERGIVADVNESSVSYTNGSLLRQTNSSRNFTSASEADDWTLVEDANDGGGPGVRNVVLTVSRENLSGSISSAFAVRLDGPSDEWRVHLYDDGSGVAVAVQNGSESSPHLVCSATGPEATVDLTAGTVNGTVCPELVWAKGVSRPYDVEFENGSEATGTYSLTVDNSSGDTEIEDENFAGPNDDESPRAVPAVYAAAVEIHFESPNLEFHTTVRIARGEPE